MKTPALALSLVLALANTPVFADQRAELVPFSKVRWYGQPLAVVVHGIRPTPGQLDPLARDLTTRGYAVYMFRYDDDQALRKSAAELAAHLDNLLLRHPALRLAVVAHSMGGLVARRALSEHVPSRVCRRTKLVTIASPFGGFVSANMSRFDFGLGPESHHDLGTRSSFIRRPGNLRANVTHYKLDTDERRMVLRRDGRRVDDSKVKPKRQRQEQVDATAEERLVLRAGHVGVINLDGRSIHPCLSEALDRILGPLRPTKQKKPKQTKQVEVKLESRPGPTTTRQTPRRGARGVLRRLGK